MVGPANLATPEDLAQVYKRKPRQPERRFTDRCKRYARRGGWLPYHNLHAKGSDPGFPDLFLMRGNRIVIAELKVDTAVTPWQDVWLSWWRCLALVSGPFLRIEVYVWRPADWPEIEAVLA